MSRLTPAALLARTEGACNRAYYGMFDVTRAALLASRTPVAPNIGKTHSGSMSVFSERLIKTTLVSKEMAGRRNARRRFI